ncbi:MAG: hypothetical protein EP298_04145 [Gammaproteobacteria bacterium]|nr:MAG: hypothetical protein EP298_04145 [Gammaproteobacteria bacterium]UTW43821.1 hypothetical protein KFE69_06955 [bacterium SCSIO 12844]
MPGTQKIDLTSGTSELFERLQKIKKEEEFDQFLKSLNQSDKDFLEKNKMDPQFNNGKVEIVSSEDKDKKFTFEEDGKISIDKNSFDFFAKSMYEMNPEAKFIIEGDSKQLGLGLARELMKAGFKGDQINFEDPKLQSDFEKMKTVMEKPVSQDNLTEQSKQNSGARDDFDIGMKSSSPSSLMFDESQKSQEKPRSLEAPF